jgi:WD40 repeat protein
MTPVPRRRFLAMVAFATPLAARAIAPPEPQSITSVAWLKPLGQPLALDRYGGNVQAVGFGSDGRQIVADADKTLFFVDAASGQPSSEPSGGHRGIADRVLIAPNAARAYVASWATQVVTENGKRVARGSGELAAADWVAGRRTALTPLTQEVQAMAVSRDGARIALGFGDGRFQIVDAASGKSLLGPVAGYAGIKMPDDVRIADVSALAFSADGKRLALAGVDAALRFFDAATGQPIGAPVSAQATGLLSIANQMAFTPDGKRLIVATQDAGLHGLDAQTGRSVVARLQMDSSATALAIAPDGRRVATGHFRGDLRRWELAPA